MTAQAEESNQVDTVPGRVVTTDLRRPSLDERLTEADRLGDLCHLGIHWTLVGSLNFATFRALRSSRVMT